MNIAAYMAACQAEDLDPMAKSALRAVAGRANRGGWCWASITRIAADMGCNYKTAQRALRRVVDAGHMTVDKSHGKAPTWKLTSVPASPDPGTCVPNLGTQGTDDGLIDKNDGEAGAQSAGENHNQAVNWKPDLPPNPWILDENTGTVTYVR